MPRDTMRAPRMLTVPTTAAAEYLLSALYVAGIVLGRSRDAGVDAWIGDLRAALTDVLPAPTLQTVLVRCRQVEIACTRAA